MYDIEACPCCGSSRPASYPALVAPFVADYVLKAKPAPARLLDCPDCSFRYFSARFDEGEVQRLYGQYRGPEYLRTRHRHEFWYSQELSDGIGAAAQEVAARRGMTLDFLRGFMDTASVRTVLDYGGDRGQFIPPELGTERSVFEISGLDTVEGVALIPSKRDLAGRAFDCILLENVLEHSSDPAALLDELKGYAGPEGSTYLFSVPFEPCSLALLPKQGPARRLYERYVRVLASVPALCSLVDFYSLAFRLKLGILPPLGFMKLHEHINFFTERSLSALLARRGFTVLGIRTVALQKFAGYKGSILCLAQAKRSAGTGPNSA